MKAAGAEDAAAGDNLVRYAFDPHPVLDKRTMYPSATPRQGTLARYAFFEKKYRRWNLDF